MQNLSYFGKKFEQLRNGLCFGISCLTRSTRFMVFYFYRYLLLHASRFYIELFYLLFMSAFGYAMLNSFDPRTTRYKPRKFDVFFTSVSSITMSSMSTVEMEVFSNGQLLVMTLLIFVGGEVFTSMVGLHFQSFSLKHSLEEDSELKPGSGSSPGDLGVSSICLDEVELGVIRHDLKSSNPEKIPHLGVELNLKNLKYKSIKFLGFVVLGYLIIVHFLGVISVLVYISVIPSAKRVLKQKGLKVFTFSLFTIVSTFANCGSLPTNENMMVFSKNSGLLLILIPQVLLGNTLFPSALRFCIWATGKFTKKVETDCLLNNTKEIGYNHLFPRLQSVFLALTVVAFIAVQFILFSAMEWNLESLRDLNTYQKIIGILFQTVNSRHTGESIVDLSTISSAVLVLFITMMYLPPYTLFLPIREEERCCQENNEGKTKRKSGRVIKKLIFPQLSYLVIFVILVCITEREKIKEDPLNFNVLNIVVEVISAYGNVGFTTGYNCDRRLIPDGFCENKWYGFVGKWSDKGKMILIVVMIFGRLKKFNVNGGNNAWKIL